MNDLVAFRLQVFKYAFFIAILFELGSLPFIGISIQFSYGLLLGACTAIMNFNLLIMFSKKVLDAGKKWFAVIGYLLRLLIYGFVFYMCMRVSKIAGLSCVFGFLTIAIALFYQYGVKTNFSTGRKVRTEVIEELENIEKAKVED